MNNRDSEYQPELVVINLAEMIENSREPDPTQLHFLTKLLNSHRETKHFFASHPIYIRKTEENEKLQFSEKYIHSFIVTYQSTQVLNAESNQVETKIESKVWFIEKKPSVSQYLEPEIVATPCEITAPDALNTLMRKIAKREEGKREDQDTRIHSHVPIDQMSEATLPEEDKERLYGQIRSLEGHKYAFYNILYHTQSHLSETITLRLVGGNILVLPIDESGVQRYIIYRPISDYSVRTEIYPVLAEIIAENGRLKIRPHLNAEKQLIKAEHRNKNEIEQIHLERIYTLRDEIFPLFPELDCQIVIDDAICDDTVYTLMNKIHAPDLTEIIKEEQKISAERFKEIACAAAFTLNEKFHKKGFIHRDIKPDNMKVILSGTLITIVYLDLDDTIKCNEGKIKNNEDKKEIFGTFPYSAPESRNSKKADIYALGITLLKLLTKKKPTDIEVKREEHETRRDIERKQLDLLLNTVDEPFKSLLIGMTMENPQERWDINQVCHYLWEVTLHDLQELKASSPKPPALKQPTMQRQPSYKNQILKRHFNSTSNVFELSSSNHSPAQKREGRTLHLTVTPSPQRKRHSQTITTNLTPISPRLPRSEPSRNSQQFTSSNNNSPSNNTSQAPGFFGRLFTGFAQRSEQHSPPKTQEEMTDRNSNGSNGVSMNRNGI